MSLISRVIATELDRQFHSHFISTALDSILNQHMHLSIQVRCKHKSNSCATVNRVRDIMPSITK